MNHENINTTPTRDGSSNNNNNKKDRTDRESPPRENLMETGNFDFGELLEEPEEFFKAESHPTDTSYTRKNGEGIWFILFALLLTRPFRMQKSRSDWLLLIPFGHIMFGTLHGIY